MRIFLALGIVAVAGCTGDTGETDETDVADTDTDTDTDTDSDTDTDTDTDVTGAVLKGFVYDAAGTPIQGARVNACRTVCYSKSTDATGAYQIDQLTPTTYSFYTVPPASSTTIETMIAVTLTTDQVIEQDIYLLEPQSAPLPAQGAEVSVAGLHLTVGQDMLEPLQFTELGDRLFVRAVEPEFRQPVEVEGTVHGMWWIGPFEATSAEGVPVSFDNSFGLAAGTELTVYAGGAPLDPGWKKCGNVVVSEDGSRLFGNAKLPILTSIVLIDEP